MEIKQHIIKKTMGQEEIIRQIRKYCTTSKNEGKKYQNACEAAKTVLREKFIAINTYIKLKERS